MEPNFRKSVGYFFKISIAMRFKSNNLVLFLSFLFNLVLLFEKLKIMARILTGIQKYVGLLIWGKYIGAIIPAIEMANNPGKTNPFSSLRICDSANPDQRMGSQTTETIHTPSPLPGWHLVGHYKTAFLSSK